jgi:hypothetical protein
MAAMAWTPFERLSSLVLFGALLVPTAPLIATVRGAFLLVGIPWISFFAAREVSLSDRFVLYSVGDDFTLLQQYAHRIFMQGYWLEGGQETFWFQPLYRWLAGSLHLIFGDSSVGEVYADAVWLLVGALFAFQVVKKVVGVRAALFAACATLATCAIGPIWYLIGRGLSEIAASGFAYAAAFFILQSDRGGWRSAAIAGLFATLTFYTRMNHLGWMIAMAPLFLPLRYPAGAWIDVRAVHRLIPYRIVLVYFSVLAVGVTLFALRTWHYTRHFSVFYGTQAHASWINTGLGLSTMFDPKVWARALSGFWVVVTVQDDPPGLNVRGLIVTAGIAASLLALLRVPFFRRLPLGLSIACFGSAAGSLIASGTAYPGRFSVHLIAISTAVATCGFALAVDDLRSLARRPYAQRLKVT